MRPALRLRGGWSLSRARARPPLSCASIGAPPLLVDVTGYYFETHKYEPTGPARLLDTRVAKVRVPAGGKVDVQVTGVWGVPNDAAMVAVNVTAVAPSGPGT